jgi:hypothetical protein
VKRDMVLTIEGSIVLYIRARNCPKHKETRHDNVTRNMSLTIEDSIVLYFRAAIFPGIKGRDMTL